MSYHSRHKRTLSQELMRMPPLRSGYQSQRQSPVPSDRSTLPSARVSARTSRLKQTTIDRKVTGWNRHAELQEVEMLNSLFLQWTWVNGVAGKTENAMQYRMEDEMFDRGNQVRELLVTRLEVELNTEQERRKELLNTVLDLETSKLSALETDAVQVTDYLLDIETAAARSLNRVPMEVESEKRLMERLQCAKHALSRIYRNLREFNPASEELLVLSQRLGETLERERQEVVQAMLYLTQLKSLTVQQRKWVLAHLA